MPNINRISFGIFLLIKIDKNDISIKGVKWLLEAGWAKYVANKNIVQMHQVSTTTFSEISSIPLVEQISKDCL